jgi:hypothetical protein
MGIGDRLQVAENEVGDSGIPCPKVGTWGTQIWWLDLLIKTWATRPGTPDRYAYVENQPLNAIDPDGYCTVLTVSSDGEILASDNGNPCPTPPPAPPPAPNNAKPLTPQQKQCIANAQADHSTATSRAWQDANHTWWVDIRNATGGGAVGGCIVGAIGGEGVGCIPGGLIGGLGGFAFGVPGGLWDGSNQLHTALNRADEDYQTAVQRCTQ